MNGVYTTIQSNGSSCDSDTSDLKGKILLHMTIKENEQDTSLQLPQIPFNLSKSDKFDALMEHILSMFGF